MASYKGVTIKPGTDAQIAEQVRAIDASQSGTKSAVQSAVTPAVPQGDPKVRELQMKLGVPATGIMDSATTTAMNSAVVSSLASNPQYQSFAGNNSPEALANAYNTGDWSGVTTLTGQPFTPEQQNEAYTAAEKALAPGFEAAKTYETSNAQDAIKAQTEDLGTFLKNDAESFKQDKISSDNSAAEQGILFSGARVQKERDLKKLYEDREAQKRGLTTRSIADTAKDFQYKYGNEGASQLSSFYNNMPAGNRYNPNVAGGAVTPKQSISSVYDPSKFNFQGTTNVSNKAATQTRAAGLLANRANKLTGVGYKTQY